MSTITQIDLKGLIHRCPECGQKNRHPFEQLHQSAKCGKCGYSLPSPNLPIELGSERDFDALIQNSNLPVLVDYWAPWCGPCRMVAPELEKVALATQGTLVVAKVNTEALPALGQRSNVRSIPTMAVYQGGRELRRTTGARPAHAIQAWALG